MYFGMSRSRWTTCGCCAGGGTIRCRGGTQSGLPHNQDNESEREAPWQSIAPDWRQTASTAPKNATLGQEDFAKILLTQLQFQDPLKPMDNQEFMAQMAQFTTLEISRQQNDNTETLLAIQSASQAMSLIGKEVEVQTDGVAQVGVVTTVSFQGRADDDRQADRRGFLTGVRLSQVLGGAHPAAEPVTRGGDENVR
ncbi:MAG: hypothetical protein MZV65_40730 [Chromatiales bacterium]|nr:hypothetical protein [Chromatiales bacterium]